jgi:outer membrane PBP1 activator LpoA protein
MSESLTTRLARRGLSFARIWRSASIAAVFIALTSAGCGPAPQTRPDPALYADANARTLTASGDLPGAAAEYLRIAALAPTPDAEQYRLAAANLLLSANDLRGARAALAHPSLAAAADGRIGALGLRRHILLARASLLEGDTEGGLQRLRTLDLDNAPSFVAKEGRQLRAAALESTGDRGGAALQRVALELLLTQPEDIASNRTALWDSLTVLPPAELATMRKPAPDTLGGWVELAILRHRFIADAPGLEGAVATWRTQFPGHPANQAVVQDIFAQSQALSSPAKHIALLLPLGGQFAEAALAIRDGFLANWFVRSGPGERPKVSIHDTHGRDIVTLAHQTINEGADFIVGPLLKDGVDALVAAAPRVPVLALNTGSNKAASVVSSTDGAVTVEPVANATSHLSAVYYFPLSPEGEAERVAEKAREGGHTQAAVLVPDSPWGSRVANAFRARWNEVGGTVVDMNAFAGDPNGLADSVRTLLQIDQSLKRAKRLSAVLGSTVEHEPRRRQDIDLIFLAAFPREARQLRPQIDFFRASQVPVYATSHVFAGQPSPNADGDVNGIIFGDMPWVLGGTSSPLREQVYAMWPGASGSYTRFYAFGADAYRLVPELGRLRSQPGAAMQGETGELHLDSDQQVQRRLQWAIFDRGVPKPLAAPDS